MILPRGVHQDGLPVQFWLSKVEVSRHCHASQSFSDSLRRLAVGWSAIKLRMKSISSAVTVRPRYLPSGILSPVWQSQNWNARGLTYFFTRSPAAIPAAPRHPDSRLPKVTAPDAPAGFAKAQNR